MFDIWTKRNEIVENAYSKQNYRILEHNGGGYCVIYCSSNDIWYPNEEYAFRNAILEKNRYEWENIHSKLASKEIYIRDIYKSWYVTGINEKIDTIDKLVHFLKTEIGELPTILIGSSSGGYLASALGCILNAEYVIAFSAQFELRNKWAEEVNPFLQKYENKWSKYYDLKDLLNQSQTPIYYIVPIKSEQDLYHYEYVKNLSCIHPMTFNSKHHGVVMPKCCLGKLISLNKSEIGGLFESEKGKILFPIFFSIHFAGLIPTVACLIKMILHKIYTRKK